MTAMSAAPPTPAPMPIAAGTEKPAEELPPSPPEAPPLPPSVLDPDEEVDWVVQAASEAVLSVMTEPSELHCCAVETLLALACESCTSVVVVDEPKPHTLSG